MKKIKWPLITAALSSLGILIYLFIKNTLTIRSIMDTFFLASLFFLIIGVTFWVMSSEFFDNFQRFMKMHVRFRKKNEPKEFTPFSEIGQAHQLFWLETGGILLIVTFVSSLFYFL